MTRTRTLLSAALATALTLAASGCSGPGEDVRVALCKDMAGILAGSDAPWSATVQEQGRFQDLIVRVQSQGAGDDADTCRYPFDSEAEDYNMSANPLAVYATYPTALSLNGEAVDQRRLAELVEQAMVKQGRELADQARAAIEQAGEQVREEISGGQ